MTQHLRSIRLVPVFFAILMLPITLAQSKDSFVAYKNADEVPQTAMALWANYDPAFEPLNIRVVKEWASDKVVTRYITFTVGTFNGVESRVAAYYSFPQTEGLHPGFVWCHGGGQRAERKRGIYFAKQGYATIDLNWLGRPLEDGVEVNTDWGAVDPSQGPRFYAKALRSGWKRNLQPDDYTIDRVTSPRNTNWFLLVLAARRAITVLEQQPEVDSDQLGCTGFSMGGMVTALAAIDPRLKAVVPMVGGTGFKYRDFPGIAGSSLGPHFKNLELYQASIDASAYWPHVNCPVLFLSSSNDFHSTFERIYQSMALLPHDDWRVSTNLHQNHGPGPEQWVLLNLWFERYLKGGGDTVPETPTTQLSISENQATLKIHPESVDSLLEVETYYSYDPNSRTRFWRQAETTLSDGHYHATLPVKDGLPLYTFAICRYRLKQARELEQGVAETMVINTKQHVIMPAKLQLQQLEKISDTDCVFENFEFGLRDWSSRNQRSITTYKFQDPGLDRTNDKKLVIRMHGQGKKWSLRIRTSSKFLDRSKNQGDFVYQVGVEGQGIQTVIIHRKDFAGPEDKTLEWAKIETFTLTLIDLSTGEAIKLYPDMAASYFEEIALVD
ncbi:MAG: acetylxylan esterase [Planctomycetota bacterium]|nr:acetylxylan esterase [Planctomycetota bacterium]